MSTTQQLTAQLRENIGTSAARELRRNKLIPAVIYGDGKDNLHVAFESRQIEFLHKHRGFMSHLIEVSVGKEKFTVIPKAVELHPVTDLVEHLDLVHVSATSNIHVKVSLHFTGADVSPGIKLGGVLNMVKRELDIICKPNNIPEVINIDVSKLDVGDSIHASNLELPEGVVLSDKDKDATIATISGRAAEEEEVSTAPVEETGETKEAEAAESSDKSEDK